MTWSTTPLVDEFLAEAGPYLTADPVANCVLLTEAHFWSRLPEKLPGASFGWWSEGGQVRGACALLPGHSALFSPLPPSAVTAMPDAFADVTRIGVDGDNEAEIVAAWQRAGRQVMVIGRLTVLRRVGASAFPLRPGGAARIAGPADRPLLHGWFAVFEQRHPGDPSHVAYVIDQPLEAGGIVIWEREGRPVAMASRTPVVAGMVRMGLAFQPEPGQQDADAAFAAACARAAAEVPLVLTLGTADESPATGEARGFTPVADRVLIEIA